MYHHSPTQKESFQCIIIPCYQNSPCYLPSCLPKQKSPHKVSQCITLKESLLFLNHSFKGYELWKNGKDSFCGIYIMQKFHSTKTVLANFHNLFLLNKLLRKNKDSFYVKYGDILQGLFCSKYIERTLLGWKYLYFLHSF